MSSTATLVTIPHALFGEATAAIDEQGGWLALVPGKHARAEVVERCRTAGYTLVEADAALKTLAIASFEHWYATGETPVLAPIGTDFQKSVWAAISAIPRGQTTTYGKISARLASAPRAVGRAVGANRLGFFVPCHRVVATYGAGGFAWGPVMKEKLLANEGVSLASLSREVPEGLEERPGRPRRHFPKPGERA